MTLYQINDHLPMNLTCDFVRFLFVITPRNKCVIQLRQPAVRMNSSFSPAKPQAHLQVPLLSAMNTPNKATSG